MLRYDFLNLTKQILSEEELLSKYSEYLTLRYHIETAQIKELVQAREKLGTTLIAENFSLPHVHYEGKQQGILLVSYRNLDGKLSWKLVLVMNEAEPEPELTEFLTHNLTESGITRLKMCNSLSDLHKIIKEKLDV